MHSTVSIPMFVLSFMSILHNKSERQRSECGSDRNDLRYLPCYFNTKWFSSWTFLKENRGKSLCVYVRIIYHYNLYHYSRISWFCGWFRWIHCIELCSKNLRRHWIWSELNSLYGNSNIFWPIRPRKIHWVSWSISRTGSAAWTLIRIWFLLCWRL